MLNKFQEEQRRVAAEAYNRNYNICLNCNKPIPLNNKRPCVVRLQKFCTRKCAGTYNNRKFPKRKGTRYCRECQKLIVGKQCDPRSRPYCFECYSTLEANAANRTISEMSSAEIRRRARQIVRKLYVMACQICGYSYAVECCHIVPISGFPDTTKISEVNSLPNLLLLCPTHHWEFDHGKLHADKVSPPTLCHDNSARAVRHSLRPTRHFKNIVIRRGAETKTIKHNELCPYQKYGWEWDRTLQPV